MLKVNGLDASGLDVHSRELLGAALLAAGRPITVKECAELLGVPLEAARRALRLYGAQLEDSALGFRLEEVAGGYRLIVPPFLSGLLAPLLAPPPLPSLSTAALEVLAVIAYKQPITRAEIEAMRGASASTIVTLQERELVKVVGRSDALGKPLLYGTTQKFLLEFGLNSLEELPSLSEADFAGLLRG